MTLLPETIYVLALPGGQWEQRYTLTDRAYTTAQMQAYGKACREAAFKESAQICDAYHGTSLGPADCAKEIRSMK